MSALLHSTRIAGLLCVLLLATAPVAAAQAKPAAKPPAKPAAPKAPLKDFAIGLDDVLGVLVWHEKDLSIDVVVRPDGNISLPLINEVHAVGLTPAELRTQLQDRYKLFVQDPNVTVVVREVNSRKVFITGRVPKPGEYPLLTPLRVVDLIAIAGGLHEFADARHLIVLRPNDRGDLVALPVDYRQITRGLSLNQNVLLQPGDTIVVP